MISVTISVAPLVPEFGHTDSLAAVWPRLLFLRSLIGSIFGADFSLLLFARSLGFVAGMHRPPEVVASFFKLARGRIFPRVNRP